MYLLISLSVFKVEENADCDDEADMQIGPGHNVGRCEEARGEVVKEGF